jgi:hypothetical protein
VDKYPLAQTAATPGIDGVTDTRVKDIFSVHVTHGAIRLAHNDFCRWCAGESVPAHRVAAVSTAI